MNGLALGRCETSSPWPSPTWAWRHLLPFPVREAVALGSTPATRFLAQGLRRRPRYRLLVVSDRATRLFEEVRDDLVEVLEHGFPVAADVAPRDLRAIAGRFARPTGRDDKERWRSFYRHVDQALTAASRYDALPIVLAGVKRSTVLFEAVSRDADLVIGRIDGAYEHATRTTLAKRHGRSCGTTSRRAAARSSTSSGKPSTPARR
jgi:hypothetical protein